MSKRCLLVDGNSIAHWRFWASDPEVGAVRSTVRWLENFVAENPPDITVVAFDGAKNWRNSILPSYKMHRPPTHEQLRPQLEQLPGELAKLGYHVEKHETYEADDVIGSYVAQRPDWSFIVVSIDKDLTQLVDGSRVLQFTPKDGVLLDVEGVRAKMGVHPTRLREYLSLWGDTSDGVPGIPGFGEKKSAAAVNETTGPEHLLEQAERGALKSVNANLQAVLTEMKSRFLQNLQLVGLRDDAPITA